MIRTIQRSTIVFIASLLALSFSLPASAQQPDAKPIAKAISLNSLSMEVNALQTVHQLQLDKGQLEKLQKWAEESCQKDRTRKAGKASKEYRDQMVAVRKALQDAKDGELIHKLTEELDGLHEKEKPLLDDRVERTELARKRVVEAYRLLKPSQLAFYLGRIADGVVDPLDRLVDAFEEVRAMNDEEWKENRNEIADDISRIAVGLDVVKSKRMSDQIVALLVRARSLSKADFQKQQGDLEQAARQIVGDLRPEDVLRHHVELDLATLLSNPRTPPACRALIKSVGNGKTPSKK